VLARLRWENRSRTYVERRIAEGKTRRGEAAVREAYRIAIRADDLHVPRELGTLEQAEPREGDEAVRDELTHRGVVRPGRCRCLARPRSAARCGHYAAPAAREAGAGLLPLPVLAHAVLLSALARLVPAAAPRRVCVRGPARRRRTGAGRHFERLLAGSTG